MKVTTKHSTSIIQGEVESVEMGMSREGQIQAIKMFRDQIYNHKAWAVVRETISNAVDEHITHNVARPVLVTLPTMNDPHFRVRDYAKGLPKEKVFSVFFQYFRSTKSNDNTNIGGFGIGAKSPLCYAEMFFVDSYHAGQKTSYVANLNGEASTAHKMDLQDSNETGIEVCVPVETRDFDKFRQLVSELLHFSGFNVEIANGEILEEVEGDYKIDNQLGKVGRLGSMFKASSEIYVRIKGIVYPVSKTDEIKNPFYGSVLLDIDANEGIEINPSRESIALTRLNIHKVNTALLALKEAAVKEVEAQIATITCARDRFKIQVNFSCFRDHQNLATNLATNLAKTLKCRKALGRHITWDSTEITRSILNKFLRWSTATVYFTPDGIDEDSCALKHNMNAKGAILLVPMNKTLRSEEVVAYAEKYKLGNSIFCISTDDANPELWVEGVDYWKLEGVTAEEMKAVRERFAKPRAPRNVQVKPAGSEVLGWKNDERKNDHQYTMEMLDTLSKNGKSFVLVSADQPQLNTVLFVLRNLLPNNQRQVVVYKSRRARWDATGFKFEDYNAAKLEKLCADYLNQSFEHQGSLEKGWANLASNPKEYIGREISKNLIGYIKLLFPNLAPQYDKTLIKKWADAQKRYDALQPYERDMVRMLAAHYFPSQFSNLRTQAKVLLDKVFA